MKFGDTDGIRKKGKRERGVKWAVLSWIVKKEDVRFISWKEGKRRKDAR